MVMEAILPGPGSTLLMTACTLLTKGFLFGLNTTKVHNLDNLTRILDLRLQPGTPESQNALITVSNHTSVMDDPIIWGILPFKYFLTPENLRWTLGSHDICFKNRFTTAFFSNGQVLPTYRLRHSPHGGLFQTVMEKTLLMLTHPTLRDSLASSNRASPSQTSGDGSTSPESITSKPLALSDTVAEPPIWLHIFPEGQIYQHPTFQMRYFKWGIARYILELPQPPIILPMFFTGMQNVMHEKRSFPRFLPRPGNDISITFGSAIPLDRWDKVRQRWRQIRETCRAVGGEEGERLLREGPEAVKLRVEVASMVRDEVEKLRIECGYPPAQPESALAETFKDKNSYLHEFEADPEKHVNS
ncbi:uncharacterized protein DFL_004046 [Arthrobotrys flagrans]|uniref:Tafazzin family protein n=1 Tax=Arthrobotrys flagrans TaxID=97331 RepID=A0A437A3L3_ARTFL|nr:hypothetical protein DFL_004046 [Arthrobotrys flagrans]